MIRPTIYAINQLSWKGNRSNLMSLTNEDKHWMLEQFKQFATREDLELLRIATRADLERVETSLLTAFHKWASPVEQRMRTYREAIRALDLEMVEISDRVTKPEPLH